jgi:ribosomal protein L12E/L44/L45/RPP1/RPP2
MSEKTEFLLTARDETREAFRSVEAGLGKLNAAVGGLFSPLAALAGVAGFGAVIKSQIDLGDQLNKTSQKLGIAVEDLSAYQYAAKLSDVSNEQLTSGLTKLARTMQDAAIDKASQSAVAFRALGVSVTDTSGNLRPLNNVLDEVSKRFEETRDGTNKTAMAVQLFGRSGSELVPLLNNLREMSDEARRTGNIVSTDFAKKSEQFNDSMTRMESAAGNLARTISGPLVGSLGVLMERLNVAIGAQESLSLDLLSKDRASLAQAYTNLTQAGLSTQSARAQYLIKQIEEVDAKIIAANLKLAETKSAQGAGPKNEMASVATLGIGDKEAVQTAKYMAELQKQVIALNESVAPQDEALAMKLNSQQLLIEDAYMRDIISLQTFEELKTGITQQYLLKREAAANAARTKEYGSQFAWQAQVNALMQGSFNQQLQGTGMMLGQMSQLMTSSKKKEFELGKKAAIGQALVSTYLGFANALSYGFPMGLIFGALVLATGLMNVQRIQSQKFGGGGGASPVYSASPGTGLPVTPDTTAAEPIAPTLPQAAQASVQPRYINITIENDSGMVSMDWLQNQFAPVFAEAVGDGAVKVVFA